jgi:hypothetical protein
MHADLPALDPNLDAMARHMQRHELAALVNAERRLYRRPRMTPEQLVAVLMDEVTQATRETGG